MRHLQADLQPFIDDFAGASNRVRILLLTSPT